VCHAGGILELKKIGVLAETYRVNLEPHNPQSYVSTMASLHVDATTPSAAIQEYTLAGTEWTEELFGGAGPVIKHGLCGSSQPARAGSHIERESRGSASLQAHQPAGV
jgi:L-alanine-DL-glutamate epimerase-like enolase superfamily enzyme